MIFLYIGLGVLAVLAVLVIIAPVKTHITRSVSSRLSPAEAFETLRSLVFFNTWSPWGEMDPNMQQGYRGTDGEIGSVSWWKGNNKVGEGEMEISKLEPHTRVEMQLRFIKPFKANNMAYFEISPEGEGCKVTWGIHAEFARPANVFMLFMNMDKAMGKDFEKGLAKWKARAEA